MNTSPYDFSDIEYQPNNNRLLGVTDKGFFALTSSSMTLIRNYTYANTLSALAVDPNDDSFYCGSLFDNTDILKFDADGNYISTELSSVQGVSQLALNNNQSILYYTETYLGSISYLNLTSCSTTLIRTGIGLSGTQEVIGIGVDDSDILYSMTADGNERGFYKYGNGTYVLLVGSKGGMSALTWFPKMQAFIAGGSFSGALIKYDISTKKASYLTPVVNSNTLIETMNGTVFYSIDDGIYKIAEDKPSLFATSEKEVPISKLIIDVNDNIFVLLANDSVTIHQLLMNGSLIPWFGNTINEWSKSFNYDIKNHDIILITENGITNDSYVYRIPVENPLDYYKILTFNNSTKLTCTTDVSGNIYLYEAYNNTLHKIPDGAMETEAITTFFVNFTGIYGPNFVVEAPICYCTVENGIVVGRNDDLYIWLLNEGISTMFAYNEIGIDNSAIFQNINSDILCTQSTVILKLIYQEPITPTTGVGVDVFILLIQIPIYLLLTIVKKRRKMKMRNS
ncbi:MAG: WD40 repeat domain-containing protein [Asgard group archaeon]|nr:WD40 repeat domain-containing protein [Asgard group archaeon]